MLNFDIPSVHLMVAAPKSGKSHLIKYLIYCLARSRRIHYVVVFSGTAFNNNYDFIPKSYVFSDYDENVLAQIMSYQQTSNKQVLIVFDDCVAFDHIFRSSQLFNKLITEHRHYKATVFIATQYIYKVSPTIRESCAYYWIFAQRTKRAYEAIYETVGCNSHDEFLDFKKFILDNTGDYYVIFADRMEEPEKMYKRFKAPSTLPRFYLNY
jgi:hypothetical protein